MFFSLLFIFFFNDPATTSISTLSLHDALPISGRFIATSSRQQRAIESGRWRDIARSRRRARNPFRRLLLLEHGKDCGLDRSEEHTSELQSHSDLVCRLLLEKKKKKQSIIE